MTHQEFLSGEAARRRYWARSYAGWAAFADRTQPNAAHAALFAAKQGTNANLDAWIALNPATVGTNDFPSIDFGTGGGSTNTPTLQEVVTAGAQIVSAIALAYAFQ
jgi:hypothetical protein